jgi:Polyketide cyclase / dehydrase and lipid transport
LPPSDMAPQSSNSRGVARSGWVGGSKVARPRGRERFRNPVASEILSCKTPRMDLIDFRASASTVVAVPAADLYSFIADMTQVGKISPVCTGGEWEAQDRGVGATFIGSNVSGDRSWRARMRVTVAEPDREFAWENIGSGDLPVPDDMVPTARWGYVFTPVEGGTRVDETWRLLHVYPQLMDQDPEFVKSVPGRIGASMEATLVNLKAVFED